MIAYFVLAVVMLVGVNADTAATCSKQHEEEMFCNIAASGSSEAAKLKTRVKQIVKTCAPNIPESCHAEKEAAHECALTIFKNVDSDAQFQESRKKSEPAVDQCFEQYPAQVTEVLEKIFAGKHLKHKGRRGGKSSEGSSESNETSASSEEHGGRRHPKCNPHGKRNATSSSASSSESKSHENKNKNATSSSSSSQDKSGGRSGGNSGGKRNKGGKGKQKSNSASKERKIPAQCRKTKEQKKCVHDELQKLVKDAAFVDTVNALINQKRKCKQIVKWPCSGKSQKREKCVFKATEPCRLVFLQKMKTCLGAKGFTLPPFLQNGDHNQLLSTPLPLPKQ